MGDVFSGVAREPFEDLHQHPKGVEAGGNDSVYLYGHVQLVVNDDPEVSGMGAGDGCRSKVSQPLVGVPS